jgi:hypothetical protein
MPAVFARRRHHILRYVACESGEYATIGCAVLWRTWPPRLPSANQARAPSDGRPQTFRPCSEAATGLVDAETDLLYIRRRGVVFEPGRATIGFVPEGTALTFYVEQPFGQGERHVDLVGVHEAELVNERGQPLADLKACEDCLQTVLGARPNGSLVQSPR